MAATLIDLDIDVVPTLEHLLDTDDDRYRWINGVHTVAINQVSLTEVHYRVFAVR